MCSSCRGFFRRVVMNDRAKGLSCATGRMACNVDSKSRKSCSWCRYQRCLTAAGMRPGWIMTQEERKARRDEREGRKRRRENDQDVKIVKRVSAVPHFASDRFLELTAEERCFIDETVSVANYSYFNTLCDILIVDASPILTVHDMILLERNVRPAFIKLFEHNSRHIFRTVFSRALGYEELSPRDREALAAANFGAFFACVTSIYLNPPDFEKVMEHCFAHMRRRAGEDDVFEIVEEVFTKINSQGKRPGLRYEQVRRSLICGGEKPFDKWELLCFF